MAAETGTTLPEVLVVLAISAILVPSIYLSIVSSFRAERGQETQVVAEEAVSRVVDRLADDIREFWPSGDRTLDPAQELALASTDARGDERSVTWYVDGSSLVRLETAGSSASVVSKVEMLTNLAVKSAVFSYWGDDGREVTDGRRIASCATRVTVNLRTDDGDRVVESSFDVAHRTRDPEVDPC